MIKLIGNSKTRQNYHYRKQTNVCPGPGMGGGDSLGIWGNLGGDVNVIYLNCDDTITYMCHPTVHLKLVNFMYVIYTSVNLVKNANIVPAKSTVSIIKRKQEKQLLRRKTELINIKKKNMHLLLTQDIIWPYVILVFTIVILQEYTTLTSQITYTLNSNSFYSV